MSIPMTTSGLQRRLSELPGARLQVEGQGGGWLAKLTMSGRLIIRLEDGLDDAVGRVVTLAEMMVRDPRLRDSIDAGTWSVQRMLADAED